MVRTKTIHPAKAKANEIRRVIKNIVTISRKWIQLREPDASLLSLQIMLIEQWEQLDMELQEMYEAVEGTPGRKCPVFRAYWDCKSNSANDLFELGTEGVVQLQEAVQETGQYKKFVYLCSDSLDEDVRSPQ